MTYDIDILYYGSIIFTPNVVKNSMEIHKTVLETYYYFAEICEDCINWTLYYPMRLLE